MFRVVLIGSTNVGKTSIHLRISGSEFRTDLTPTTGGQFIVHTESWEGFAPLSFQIWDTAGQERFRGIAPMYYRDAQAAIAVFSINDRQSFADLPGWVEDFEKVVGTEGIVFIVANKMDLHESPNIQEVNLNEAQRWARDHEFSFFGTSALKGEGIDEFLHELAVVVSQRGLKPKVKVESAVESNKGRCC